MGDPPSAKDEFPTQPPLETSPMEIDNEARSALSECQVAPPSSQLAFHLVVPQSPPPLPLVFESMASETNDELNLDLPPSPPPLPLVSESVICPETHDEINLDLPPSPSPLPLVSESVACPEIHDEINLDLPPSPPPLPLVSESVACPGTNDEINLDLPPSSPPLPLVSELMAPETHDELSMEMSPPVYQITDEPPVKKRRNMHQRSDRSTEACKIQVETVPLVSGSTAETDTHGEEQMEAHQMDLNCSEDEVSDRSPAEMALQGSVPRNLETQASSGSESSDPIVSTGQRGMITEYTPSGEHKSPDTDEAQSEAKQRHRGRPKGWRKETDMKKEKSGSIIANKCYIDIAMNFFHKEVLNKLNPEHIRLIATTPFLHLFAFPKGTQTSNAVLHHILLMWDNDKGVFNFRGSELNFTADEVSLLMCLPYKGSPVTYKRKVVTKSTLRCRHFKHNRDISRKQLEKAILKAIDDQCVETDVVGLLIMYLFTTILFPQAGGCVPVHMFHYVDNIDRLRTYAWGDAVYQLLMDNIPFCSVWCRLMEKGGENNGDNSNEEEEKKKAVKKSSSYLPGCTLALIVWFFEHTKFRSALKYIGHIPRYLNWKLDITWRRESFRRALVDVLPLSVNANPLACDKSEEILKESGFVAASYITMLGNANTLQRMHNKPMFMMLIEMTPIFWKFGMIPCSLLINEAPIERFQELSYEEKPKNLPLLDDISPTLEQKMCEHTSMLEWRFGIHEKLMKTRHATDSDSSSVMAKIRSIRRKSHRRLRAD